MTRDLTETCQGAYAHHVLLGGQVLHRPMGELGALVEVVPLAVGVRLAEVFHRHLCVHAAHVALESPAQQRFQALC